MFYGTLPALVITAIKIKPQGTIRTLAVPVVMFILSFALAAALLMADLKTYASILRLLTSRIRSRALV
ncbi:hypothetical protein C1J02_12390 [Sulfitobacter sp. SK011]|nr:hypothetical protein C1J02_12390 [Sulfitobacter sp. SK011]